MKDFNLKSALKTKLLEPWWFVYEENADFKACFSNQLKKEISFGHALFGLDAEIIARGNGDDCLFVINQSQQVALVHLTWSSFPEKPPFPHTIIFETFDDWFEKYYLPDIIERLGITNNLSYFEQVTIGYSLGFISETEFEQFIYNVEEAFTPLTHEIYLELISSDFNNSIQVLKVLDVWFTEKLPDCKHNLTEMRVLFGAKN